MKTALYLHGVSLKYKNHTSVSDAIQWLNNEAIDRYFASNGPGIPIQGQDGQPVSSEGNENGTQVRHLQLRGEESPVQWAIVSTQNTVFIVFKGTNNINDIVTDLCCQPMDSGCDGLEVHTAMWGSLHRAGDNGVVNQIQTKLSSFDWRDKRLILCGHSLGAGYAILCGLDLLHRFSTGTAIQRDIVSSMGIYAHGSPQVIIPQYENLLWQRLNAAVTVYVNEWDAVPRLPACENWIDDVLLSKAVLTAVLQKEATKKKGRAVGLVAGLVAGSFREGLLQQAKKYWISSKYRHIGTVMFISKHVCGAMSVPSFSPNCDDPGAVCHQQLCKVPDPLGAFVIEQHRGWGAYPTIVGQVSSAHPMQAAVMPAVNMTAVITPTSLSDDVCLVSSPLLTSLSMPVLYG